MNRQRWFFFTILVLTGVALFWPAGQVSAQYVPPPQLVPGVDYNLPNFANSPVLTKFVDKLPGLTAGGLAVPGFYSGANGLGQALPVAIADTTTFAGDAYYEIALVDYTEQMHSDLPATKLRGYVQLSTAEVPGKKIPLFYADGVTPIMVNGVQAIAVEKPHYLGPVIVATKGVATRIKFYNLLATGAAGDLFIPTDVTVMGAGTGPNAPMGTDCSVNPRPSSCYSQNRATLHLHGGDNPWVSDGTAHQWITPAGEASTLYKKGASQQNVPDMPVPSGGSATFYWPNGQSGRLMFYHDHAYGITRLDVYAGEAAGYLLVDPDELALTPAGGQVPLVFQDKTFVNDGTTPPLFPPGAIAPAATTAVDPLWASNPLWGQTKGSLWWPHVYMPNQNPNDLSGANPFGRWDYGAWFWPIFPSGVPPQTSITPEGFMDTPVVNGTAYPYLEVQPQAYRFRMLNACNDRYLNLQLYVATSIVSSITLNSGGSGYKYPPYVTIAPAAGDTTGQGATALATIDTTVGSPTYGQVTGLTLATVGGGYTLPPVVTISPPTTVGGVAATASATIFTSLTPGGLPSEVGMMPAYKMAPVAWPDWWMANDTPGMTPNILDGRQGGVPDPRNMGPSFIHIGSEGGIAKAPVVLDNTPIGYEQNKRSVTVLNTFEHTLFMGPAERADVIIDFSQFAGQTLILYNDAPAPLPAGDPRWDYYTLNPDSTSTGGAPPTQPGFGPNTRTVMQIRVAAGTGTAFDPATLNDPMTAAFAATQPAPVVPAGTYARISDTSMTFGGKTYPLQPKTIQELFDPLGRMNATLGVEMPFTTAVVQTTIPYGFVDPATEVIPDGATQLWKITHNGVDTHAIHFHLFNVQLVNRVGWDGAIKPPWPEEVGWKETVKMNPLEDIVVALRAKTPTVPFNQPSNVRALDPTLPIGATGANANFLNVDPNNNPVTVINQMANFGHEYTWHCHLLGHEENDMMRPIMVAAAPNAPSSLAATTKGSNLVLTWKNNDPTTSSITVQRASNSAFTVGLVSVQLTGAPTTYTDKSYVAGTTYYYRVGTSSVVGSGVAGYPSVTTAPAFSNVIGPPAAVVTLNSVTQAAAAKSPVVVAWSFTGNGQTGFTIQRATNSAFTAGLTSFAAGATATSYSDTSTKANVTYWYRVIPTNPMGNGTPSGSKSITPHA